MRHFCLYEKQQRCWSLILGRDEERVRWACSALIQSQAQDG